MWLPKSRYSMQTGSYEFSLGAPTALDELSAGNNKTRSLPHKVKADKSHQTVLCPIATMNNPSPKGHCIQNKNGAEVGTKSVSGNSYFFLNYLTTLTILGRELIVIIYRSSYFKKKFYSNTKADLRLEKGILISGWWYM